MDLKLKALRKKAGLTQHEAAKKLGVSQSTIAMWEVGANAPRAGLFQKIAEVYSCTVAEIFEN